MSELPASLGSSSRLWRKGHDLLGPGGTIMAPSSCSDPDDSWDSNSNQKIFLEIYTYHKLQTKNSAFDIGWPRQHHTAASLEDASSLVLLQPGPAAPRAHHHLAGLGSLVPQVSSPSHGVTHLVLWRKELRGQHSGSRRTSCLVVLGTGVWCDDATTAIFPHQLGIWVEVVRI